MTARQLAAALLALPEEQQDFDVCDNDHGTSTHIITTPISLDVDVARREVWLLLGELE